VLPGIPRSPSLVCRHRPSAGAIPCRAGFLQRRVAPTFFRRDDPGSQGSRFFSAVSLVFVLFFSWAWMHCTGIAVERQFVAVSKFGVEIVFRRSGLQPLKLQGLKALFTSSCTSGLKPGPPKKQDRSKTSKLGQHQFLLLVDSLDLLSCFRSAGRTLSRLDRDKVRRALQPSSGSSHTDSEAHSRASLIVRAATRTAKGLKPPNQDNAEPLRRANAGYLFVRIAFR
jgi:hypothetical protein